MSLPERHRKWDRDLRQLYAIHLKNTTGIHAIDHLDFFPSFVEAKIMVIIYQIRWTEKVAMQLVKNHADAWKREGHQPFHLMPKDWIEFTANSKLPKA